MLMRDTKNPSDAATHPHDITHILDALRYFALYYRETKKRPIEVDPLAVFREKAMRKARRGVQRNRF
jgi:hypothetical protein